MLLSKFMLFIGTQKQITLIARGNTLIHSGIHDLHFRSSKIRLYEIILILNIFEMIRSIFKSIEKMFIEILLFSLAIQLYIRVNDH